MSRAEDIIKKVVVFAIFFWFAFALIRCETPRKNPASDPAFRQCLTDAQKYVDLKRALDFCNAASN